MILLRCSIAVIVAGLLLAYGSSFEVREAQNAIFTQFGNPVRTVRKPGLHGKIPWPIEQVHPIDMETQKREAEGFAKGKIPAARAETDKLIKEATAYEASLVAKAKAELSVFTETYEQYRRNPALVSKRIAMETFEQIMQDVGNPVFARPGTRGILPTQEAKRD